MEDGLRGWVGGSTLTGVRDLNETENQEGYKGAHDFVVGKLAQEDLNERRGPETQGSFFFVELWGPSLWYCSSQTMSHCVRKGDV